MSNSIGNTSNNFRNVSDGLRKVWKVRALDYSFNSVKAPAEDNGAVHVEEQ